MDKFIYIALIAVLSGSVNVNASNNNMYVGLDILGSGIGNVKAKSIFHKDRQNTEYNGGKSFGGILSLGYNISKIVDLDISVQYSHKNSLSETRGRHLVKHQFDIFAPMARILYNHYIKDDIKLYLGAGIGFARIYMNHDILEDGQILSKINIPSRMDIGYLKIKELDPKTSIALGAYAGISKMVNNVSFELGYSFGYFGKTCEENNKIKAIPLDIYMNSVSAGIKFHF